MNNRYPILNRLGAFNDSLPVKFEGGSRILDKKLIEVHMRIYFSTV